LRSLLRVSTLTLIGAGLMLQGPVSGQSKKPNFSGRWVLNSERSDFGRMPAPKSYVDEIDHQDPTFIVNATSEDQRGETKSFMKLTTDGQENINEVNGNEFRSKSRWQGEKLVTVVTGNKGMQMTEVRYLSGDGKSQTVEMYMGEMKGNPQMKRVMDKKGK
jgi:hypothetical protein